MKYQVLLKSRKMGGFCKSCVQDHSFEVEASSNEEAVAKAKEESNIDLDYYKINIVFVRALQ